MNKVQTATAVIPSQRIRPRLGFVGTGWIGQIRMKALAHSGLADIAAICEPNPEMARMAQNSAPECAITRSFDEMLCADIDGVIIATPSALHAEQATAALQRGIAVFCQKPLGRNQTETARAIDAAQTANRLLKVDLSYRFVKGIQEIEKLMRAGELGEIYYAELVFHNAYGPGKGWFYDRKLSGGGCLIDLGIHLIDLGLWLLDFPEIESISSKLFREGRRLADRSHEVEDFASAAIDLNTGTRLNIACSWNAHADRDAVIEAAFYGSAGGARFRNVNGSFYDFIAERFRGTKCELLASPPDDWGGRAALDWLTRLCEVGDRFDPDISHLNAVAAAIDRIYES